MKELEQQVMCVLLQRLLDQNLIPQETCEKAKNKILDTLDEKGFFCYCEEKQKEEDHGHTKNTG